MEEKSSFEDLPYREALTALRELNRNEDADFLEAQIDEIMKELGIEEPTLEKMTFREVGETLSVYYLNLQNKMLLQGSSDVPLSLEGRWLVGKNISPELAMRVARIQSQRMQEEKIKMGFYG